MEHNAQAPKFGARSDHVGYGVYVIIYRGIQEAQAQKTGLPCIHPCIPGHSELCLSWTKEPHYRPSGFACPLLV